MAKFAPVLLLALAIASGAIAQDLSTEVYPSEDELYLALLAGDIDYHQFQRLLEIIRTGVGATDRHLIDEVPNLSYFLEDPTTLSTALQGEQAASFDQSQIDAPATHFDLRYRHTRLLEEDSESQYRTSVRWNRGNWSTDLHLQRERSGIERIVKRQATYRTFTGAIREISLGTFTRRLGLGTAFGYRGKLLDFSGRLSDESFLFPDYGGYNGAYARIQRAALQLQLLASFNRDTDHSLATLAAMVNQTGGGLRLGLIAGINRLKNRHTDGSRYDLKVAPSLEYHYGAGYASVELCGQAGSGARWGGGLLEGRHRFSTAQIQFAAWNYGQEYLDLSGGSKSGSSRRSLYLEEVDFSLSEKRSGHRGGMVKTIVLMSSRTQLVNSLLYSAQHRDSADMQLLSGLLRQFSPGWSLRLDHLVKTRRRLDSGDATVVTSHRTRLESRITAGPVAVRSYIGYNTKSGRSDYFSAFVHLDYLTPRTGRWQLWSNLARLDGREVTIEYWYLFVQNEQTLAEGVTAAAKISRAYDRDAGARHESALSVEVRVVW